MFDLLMTYNNLHENVLNMALGMSNERARNPRNQVVATNPVYDFLMTSNDL